MDQYYYELIVKADKYIDILESYMLDISEEALERSTSDEIILRTEKDPQKYKKMIEDHCKVLGKIFEDEINCIVSIQKKRNIDWIRNYKESFVPFELGSFYIHAAWHKEKEDKINISIDPELSFGTGHHETTRVCLRAIEKQVKKDQTFLDVGCGSGILSIAAAKMGAKVSLCDIDTLSIQNAKNNLKNNGIEPEAIWEGSAAQSKLKYDIVAVNIVSDILIFLKKDIIARMKKESHVILSGILEKYEEKVKKAYAALTPVDRIQEGEWVCLIYKKEE